MVRRATGVTAACACWLILLGAIPQLQAQDIVPAPPEPAILELQLGRLAARTVPAYRLGNVAYVPLTQFLDLAEIRYSLQRGQLTATLQPGDRKLVIDAGAARATVGQRVLALAPQDLITEPQELFLAAARLAELLQLEIRADWSDLQVVVRDPSSLPIAQRIQRERARAALRRGGSLVEPDRFLTSDGKRLGGFVLDYSVFSPSNDPFAGSSYTIAAGADLLGGSLEAGIRSDGPAGDGNVRLDASWLGVWRTSALVRQLRLGDGFSTGPRLRSIRGLSVTNAPFLRPSFLTEVRYRGTVPAGWEVEAYRNGVLIGVDTAAPSGTFDVSFAGMYGENPVDFVAYGPFGDRREFSRKYRIPQTLVARHRLEYGLSAGECRVEDCSTTANVDMRYGVSDRLTVGGGAEQFWHDSASAETHPYVGAVGILSPALTADGELAGRGFLRGRLNYEPTLDLRVALEGARYLGDSASRFLNPLGRDVQYALSAFWRPNSRRNFAYIDGRIEYARDVSGSSWRGRTGLSLDFGDARVVPYVRLDRQQFGASGTEVFAGLELFAIPNARWAPFFRRMWLRAAAEARDGTRPSFATLTIARSLSPALRLEAGTAWVKGGGGPAWTFSLSSAFPSLRAFTVVTVPADGPATATQAVQGSVLYDASRRQVAFTAGPSLQRGGLAGRVYLDENANGRPDPGEPGLPNVRVQVGNGAAYSDSLGYYRAWDAVPFEPVLVRADSLSFESPLWVPGFELAAVVPSPNRLTMVDIPILRGVVLEGRVVSAATGSGLSGVRLQLRERRSGASRTITTFNDGSFYALGITPGDYVLEVDPRVLETLGMTATPAGFVVQPGSDGVDPVQLRLVDVP